MYAKSAAARLLLSLDWLIKSQLLIPCGSSLCYTNCMNHLITHLHLNSSFAAVQVRAGFLALPGWLQHPKTTKKCFIFLVYSLAVRIIQIIGSNLSLFFITVAAVVHCGMFITHNIWPVFFLLGVKCQLYFDGRVDIPAYDWFLLVCCPNWSWMTFAAIGWAINEWTDGTCDVCTVD